MSIETSVTLSYKTIGIYPVKINILRALRENAPNFYGTLLDVGCGNQPYREMFLQNARVTKYVGLDIQYPFAKIKPDLYWDGTRIPLDDHTIDTVVLTEVLEHCPYPQAVLTEIFRVLKPGGQLFLTVPFLWMLHEVPHDEYRYTPFSLKRHLEGAGFKGPEIKGLGGWNASMAQMLGMWLAYRQGGSKLIRAALKIILLPVVYFLLKSDKGNNTFGDQTMITGLYALVKK